LETVYIHHFLAYNFQVEAAGLDLATWILDV
jgi:hypothetical protein